MELPTHIDTLKSWTRTRLWRLLVLQESPEILNYYVQQALTAVCEDEPALHEVGIRIFETLLRDTFNVNRKLFFLMVAVNTSNRFYEYIWVNTPAERQLFESFALLLCSEFCKFDQKKTRDGKPATTPEEVAYPTLDSFVETMRRAYLSM